MLSTYLASHFTGHAHYQFTLSITLRVIPTYIAN